MRVEIRTETSRTRHHLQGGVSTVVSFRETDPHESSSRRSDGRTRESDGYRGVLRRGQGRFVLMRRTWRAPETPARPPATPYHPTSFLGAKPPRRPENPYTNSNSSCGAGGVTWGPVSSMNTLISLRMPNRPGR